MLPAGYVTELIAEEQEQDAALYKYHVNGQPIIGCMDVNGTALATLKDRSTVAVKFCPTDLRH
jgi:hypothetical protein